MNRTMRLLGIGTGLVVGVLLLPGPAQAGPAPGGTQCCQKPDLPRSEPVFGRDGGRLASHTPGDPKKDDKKEEVVTDFQKGDWFPAPVGVY